MEPFWNRRPAPTGTQRSFGRRREAPLAGVLCCPGIEHRNGQRGICARLCPIKRPEIGVSLPDRNLDPAGFEETLRNRANDALLGNVPRPDLLKAPLVVRACHRVEVLAGHVPDLTALDTRPSDAIAGPRFGKDGRGRPPAVGTQFAGIGAGSMWPMPGEAA